MRFITENPAIGTANCTGTTFYIISDRCSTRRVHTGKKIRRQHYGHREFTLKHLKWRRKYTSRSCNSLKEAARISGSRGILLGRRSEFVVSWSVAWLKQAAGRRKSDEKRAWRLRGRVRSLLE
ncbi:hypothetical protein QLX08_008496 [Tetragonisca angustula]|uniref:Uncharacterized protein n=1 Tax=Tetragonisca angustula TaxID=166442 RepID=A0AAW0ZLE9_9HYME